MATTMRSAARLAGFVPSLVDSMRTRTPTGAGLSELTARLRVRAQ